MLIVGLRYIGFSTGRYGSGTRFPGVCLQFESEGNGTIYYAIFNAKLDRARNSGKGRAGAALPKNQFRVTKRYAFCQFWLRVGLALPPRPSSFHDYMGNLKPLVLMGEVSDNKNRLEGGSIQVMALQSEPIQTDRAHTQPIQRADNWQTAPPDKEFAHAQYLPSFEADQNTGHINHEKSLKGNADTSQSIRWPKTYEELQRQSIEDWLLDYEEAADYRNEP